MDRTNELREAVARHAPSQDASLQAGPSSKQPPPKQTSDEWLATAKITASTLFSLSVFLSGIRKAYLQPSSSSSTRTPGKGQRQRALDFSNGLLGVDTREWTWMSDRERDEVDVQVKSMLRASMAKIKQLEAVERTRQTQAKSRWTRESTSSTALAAHRQSIILFLNNLASSVSSVQTSQQEQRLQRTLDKHNHHHHHQHASSSSAALPPNAAKDLKPVLSDEPPIESLLSQEQMQAFEDEAQQLTEAAQTQLSQIKSAETSLLEISALQSELVIHLTQQNEVTTQLWEDSMFVSTKVDDANKQLGKARDRNRESRIWLLVFLIGASLTLLFLDSY